MYLALLYWNKFFLKIAGEVRIFESNNFLHILWFVVPLFYFYHFYIMRFLLAFVSGFLQLIQAIIWVFPKYFLEILEALLFVQHGLCSGGRNRQEKLR